MKISSLYLFKLYNYRSDFSQKTQIQFIFPATINNFFYFNNEFSEFLDKWKRKFREDKIRSKKFKLWNNNLITYFSKNFIHLPTNQQFKKQFGTIFEFYLNNHQIIIILKIKIRIIDQNRSEMYFKVTNNERKNNEILIKNIIETLEFIFS